MASAPILVLVAPQDIVNIASAVRIAKNFGIERMRLVQPEIFDAYRIEGIAHNTADLVERIGQHVHDVAVGLRRIHAEVRLLARPGLGGEVVGGERDGLFDSAKSRFELE